MKNKASTVYIVCTLLGSLAWIELAFSTHSGHPWNPNPPPSARGNGTARAVWVTDNPQGPVQANGMPYPGTKAAPVGRAASPLPLRQIRTFPSAPPAISTAVISRGPFVPAATKRTRTLFEEMKDKSDRGPILLEKREGHFVMEGFSVPKYVLGGFGDLLLNQYAFAMDRSSKPLLNKYTLPLLYLFIREFHERPLRLQHPKAKELFPPSGIMNINFSNIKLYFVKVDQHITKKRKDKLSEEVEGLNHRIEALKVVRNKYRLLKGLLENRKEHLEEKIGKKASDASPQDSAAAAAAAAERKQMDAEFEAHLEKTELLERNAFHRVLKFTTVPWIFRNASYWAVQAGKQADHLISKPESTLKDIEVEMGKQKEDFEKINQEIEKLERERNEKKDSLDFIDEHEKPHQLLVTSLKEALDFHRKYLSIERGLEEKDYAAHLSKSGVLSLSPGLADGRREKEIEELVARDPLLAKKIGSVGRFGGWLDLDFRTKHLGPAEVNTTEKLRELIEEKRKSERDLEDMNVETVFNKEKFKLMTTLLDADLQIKRIILATTGLASSIVLGANSGGDESFLVKFLEWMGIIRFFGYPLVSEPISTKHKQYLSEKVNEEETFSTKKKEKEEKLAKIKEDVQGQQQLLEDQKRKRFSNLLLLIGLIGTLGNASEAPRVESLSEHPQQYLQDMIEWTQSKEFAKRVVRDDRFEGMLKRIRNAMLTELKRVSLSSFLGQGASSGDCVDSTEVFLTKELDLLIPFLSSFSHEEQLLLLSEADLRVDDKEDDTEYNASKVMEEIEKQIGQFLAFYLLELRSREGL